MLRKSWFEERVEMKENTCAATNKKTGPVKASIYFIVRGFLVLVREGQRILGEAVAISRGLSVNELTIGLMIAPVVAFLHERDTALFASWRGQRDRFHGH